MCHQRLRRDEGRRTERIHRARPPRSGGDSEAARKVVEPVCNPLTQTEIERVEGRDTTLGADLGVTIAERTRRLHLHVGARPRVVGHRIEDLCPNWRAVVTRNSFDHQLKARPARPLKHWRTVIVDVHWRESSPIRPCEPDEYHSGSPARRRARGGAWGWRRHRSRDLEQLRQVSWRHRPIAVDIRTWTLAAGAGEQTGNQGVDIRRPNSAVAVDIAGQLGRNHAAHQHSAQRDNANDEMAEANDFLTHAPSVAKKPGHYAVRYAHRQYNTTTHRS